MNAATGGAECRRPITFEERPHLVALGHRLAEARKRAGLQQTKVAAAAGITASTLWRIEHAYRRTRVTTLGRLSAAIADVDPTADRERLLAELVTAAGPALASESDYPERVARRRERRGRKVTNRAVAADLAAEQARARDAKQQAGRERRALVAAIAAAGLPDDFGSVAETLTDWLAS